MLNNQDNTNLNGTSSDYQTTSSPIFDLKKYKYDYFISKLSCNFDNDYAKFGSPTGICTLNNDYLLVANFDLDSLLILDINGTVHQIYKDLPTPKDVLYYSSNPSQAVVATKRDLVILDLNTKQIVRRTNRRGFYPWNIQYIKEHDILIACDPGSELIVYLDKNLAEIGSLSFHDPTPCQPQTYQKIYPYAARFFPDGTSFVLTNRENKFKLKEYNIATDRENKTFDLPPTLQSYSIYVDNERKCLIPDKANHCLVSVDKNLKVEEYKSKFIHEPYSMTFLSTGALCVTDWNKSLGTNGGIAVISEIDLTTNQ